MMRNKYTLYILLLISTICFYSCKPRLQPNEPVEKTLFMYYPWSTNLLSFFENNIHDMERCLINNKLDDCRVIIYLATSSTEAELFEIKRGRMNSISRELINTYEDYPDITTNGLSKIITEVKDYAPAHSYSMVVSAHGMGWLPVNRESRAVSPLLKIRDQNEDIPLTRFFGGKYSSDQMDINELAGAIELSETNFDCILFDACYMANVEVAYELRDVCEYFIASAAEIMAYGMPYHYIGADLINGDYSQLCENFYKFYSEYSTPCGTISVVESANLEPLAGAMKIVNSNNTLNNDDLNSIQILDVYTPSIFFDFKSYLDKLCLGSDEYNSTLEALNEAVPYKANTDTYFTNNKGEMPLDVFSGITISDPSLNTMASEKNKTEWWTDTH